ncbi:hypothetical protein GLYMA_12G189666v4 [Glycine max]|nr:hypothetical protein GLYMA_12G189666v4 [Glycine max]KAH1143905.1 hypothetical protein GYH30_034229 [Glycine max]
MWVGVAKFRGLAIGMRLLFSTREVMPLLSISSARQKSKGDKGSP